MNGMELFEAFVGEYARRFLDAGWSPFEIEHTGYRDEREFLFGVPFSLFDGSEERRGTLKIGFIIDECKPLNNFLLFSQVLFDCETALSDDVSRERWADALYCDLVVYDHPLGYLNGISMHQELIDEGFDEEDVSDFYGVRNSFRNSDRGLEIREMIDEGLRNFNVRMPKCMDLYHRCRDEFFGRHGLAFDDYGDVVSANG